VGTQLIQLLEQEARVEKDQVLKEAQAKAEEIIAAAGREAGEIEAAAKQRVETERAQARARATSTASLRAASLVLAAKDEAIRKVFEQTETEVRTAAGDSKRRGTVLRALLREAAQGLSAGGGRVTVEAARGDVQAVRDAAKELGLDAEVREAAGVTDGVRVAAADGRVVVENTLGSRLARARREMVSRVAETLWSR